MTFAATRSTLQQVATHVLARRRHEVTGRFGLRATPGGFGTPAFGPPDAIEVVRVTGTSLVREVGGQATVVAIAGASLAALAQAAGCAGLDDGFAVGHDTPPRGDVDAPLAVEPADAAVVASWFDLGWQALDAVAAGGDRPGTIQLWPEHFDAGCSVAVGPGEDDRCNLGASAGDGFSDEPYLYVGPWSADRPGDEAYWNAPFGAVLRRTDVRSVDDGVAFLRRGVALLRGGAGTRRVR